MRSGSVRAAEFTAVSLLVLGCGGEITGTIRPTGIPDNGLPSDSGLPSDGGAPSHRGPFYLAPTGDDVVGQGTSAFPWRTLGFARDQIRRIPVLNSDTVVILKDGIYELPETFELTPADSGRDGFKVVYKAENAGAAVLSGGSLVQGWSDADGDGVWEAQVPPGSRSRQLYVNGARAVRARSSNGAGWVRNGTGYQTPQGVASWPNHQDIELVFGYRWKQYRGQVVSISGRQATMEPDFFTGSAVGPFGLVDQNAAVSWVENNLALLDQGGEWYVDYTKGLLYYKPRPGENLVGPGAVPVVLPRLEMLVHGTGVRDVRFENLTFSHATWLRPDQPMGYQSIQAGVTMNDPNYPTIEAAFEDCRETRANVYFEHSTNLVFSRNTFKNLGGAGLGLGRGCQQNTVFDNTFEQISAAAIIIGNPQDHHPTRPAYLVKDNLVDHNLIKNVSSEYRDAPAITSLWAERTVVINNTIEHVPYSGISVGWGWGRYDVDPFEFTTDNTGKAYNYPTVLKDTLVINNMINRPMSVRHDGGGIYNLSSNVNSRVSGNVITGAHDLNGAVYLDNGSRGFVVIRNVTYNNRGPRRDFHIKGGQYHTIPNSGSDANDLSGSRPNYNPNFQAIVEAAGRKPDPIERTIESIVSGLPPVPDLPPGTVEPAMGQGLVVGKAASASSNPARAQGAIDVDPTTFWDGGAASAGWLQVDLGTPVALQYVQVAFGTVDPMGQLHYTRRGITFEIQSSDNGQTWRAETFFTDRGYNNTLVNPTTSLTTVQAINAVEIRGNPVARYVRINITNTGGQPLAILRLKVTRR